MTSRQLNAPILVVVFSMALGAVLGISVAAQYVDTVPVEQAAETKVEIVYNDEAGARCFVLLQRGGSEWRPTALSCMELENK